MCCSQPRSFAHSRSQPLDHSHYFGTEFSGARSSDMEGALGAISLMEDEAASLPMSQLSDTDQFMIMLNVCAAVCGSFIYCLLNRRQRQSASQRGEYFAGPFISLGEASQSWKVYRQCSSKSDRDMHVCNFCGFAIKAAPADLGPAGTASASPPPARQDQLVGEDGKGSSAKEGLKGSKKINKKGKKS